MKHTKGPWRQSDNELGYESFDILADAGFSVHNLGIATVVDPRFSDPDFGTVALDRDTCNANARLIAAAPELLEACKVALEMWANGAYAGDWQRNSAKLIAAIAKAEGSEK